MATTIRLEPELEARYKKLAADTGRSQSYYIRQALENEIDELEWTYDILRISEEVRSGKQKTIPLSEVLAEYGIQD